MVTIDEYVVPSTLEEAYEILSKRKNNQILGGCAWLRMQKRRIGTAIDLAGLELQFINHYEDRIEIGAMTTFREIETSEVLKKYFGETLSDSVSSIIGVQFRNVVTVGGSVFSKFGFSDFIPVLIALNAKVELYNGGVKTLEEFINEEYKKDILIKVILPKENIKSSYKMIRTSASDFPILNLCVSKIENTFKVVVGAAPRRAQVAINTSKFLSENEINEENLDKVAEILKEEIIFGTNSRGSKEYRKAVSETLAKRAIMEVI